MASKGNRTCGFQSKVRSTRVVAAMLTARLGASTVFRRSRSASVTKGLNDGFRQDPRGAWIVATSDDQRACKKLLALLEDDYPSSFITARVT